MVVVLDANVLYPASLRDTLLRMAAAGLFQPAWTGTIWDEVITNLMEKPKQPMPHDAAAYLRTEVEKHFPDATISGYEDLVPRMTNDQKDRHVLAAAVHVRASYIVTFNPKHFPESALSPFGISAQEPDEFLTTFVDVVPGTMARIIRKQASALTRPPTTPARVLDTLAQHAPHFVALIRPRVEGAE